MRPRRVSKLSLRHLITVKLEKFQSWVVQDTSYTKLEKQGLTIVTKPFLKYSSTLASTSNLDLSNSVLACSSSKSRVFAARFIFLRWRTRWAIYCYIANFASHIALSFMKKVLNNQRGLTTYNTRVASSPTTPCLSSFLVCQQRQVSQ